MNRREALKTAGALALPASIVGLAGAATREKLIHADVEIGEYEWVSEWFVGQFDEGTFRSRTGLMIPNDCHGTTRWFTQFVNTWVDVLPGRRYLVHEMHYSDGRHLWLVLQELEGISVYS